MNLFKKLIYLKFISTITAFLFSMTFLPFEILAKGTPDFYNIDSPSVFHKTSTLDPKVIENTNNLGRGDYSDNFYVHHWPDPVNVRNGNLFLPFEDFNIRGPGPNLLLSRTYNSRSLYNGPFGFGWTSTYSSSIKDHGDTLELTESDGYRNVFHQAGTEKNMLIFKSCSRACQTIDKKGDGSYIKHFAKGAKHFYDGKGRLTKIADRFGNYIKATYENNRLSSVGDKMGRNIEFSYGRENRIVSVKDPIGRIVRYRYSVAGDLIEVTDASGNTTQFEYNNFHNIRKIIYPNAGETIIEYDDKKDWVLSQEGPGEKKTAFRYISYHDRKYSRSLVKNYQGNQTSYEYLDDGVKEIITDSLGHRTERGFSPSCGSVLYETDPEGNKIRYQYDNKCRLVSVINKRGNVRRYEYDNNNNVTKKVDPRGGITSYKYDNKGNLISLVLPSNRVLNFRYDESGNMTKYIDPKGNVTLYKYDGYGNLVEEKNPKGHVFKYQYDKISRLTGVIDPRGAKTKITYNALNRATNISSPGGKTLSFRYNSMGDIAALTLPEKLEQRFEYDLTGRLTGVYDFYGNGLSYQYSALRNSVTYTDGEGNTTEFYSDSKGRLIAIYDSLGNRTEFEYDRNDNLSRIIDPKGNQTSRFFDAENNIVKIIDPLKRETLFEYDANGRLVKLVTPEKKSKMLTYNQDGQVEKITYDDGSKLHFTYDRNGNPLSVNNKSTSLTFKYDELDQLIEAMDSSLKRFVKYRYDENGQKTKTIIMDGEINYKYDESGRLIEIKTADGRSYTFIYDKLDVLKKTIFPNGMTRDISYDISKKTVELFYRNTAKNRLYSVSYGFDRAGNRLWKSENGERTGYTYDSLYRLILVTMPDDRKIEYSYDASGNRTLQDIDGKVTQYFYDKANQLVKSQSDTQVITYEYDTNGNRIRQSDGKGEKRFIYDLKNRLIEISTSDGKKTSFGYDLLGKRRWKLGEEGKVFFFYDGDNIINILGETGESLVSFLNGPGVDNQLEVTRGRSTYYYLKDGINNVVGLTDQSFRIVENYAYLPFGDGLKEAKEGGISPFRFTGREYDEQNELYYYRARYYDSITGRFISQDPVYGFFENPQTFNRYTYVLNNPVNLIDPYGKFSAIEGIIAAVIGAIALYGFYRGISSMAGTTKKFGDAGKSTKDSIQDLINIIRDNPASKLNAMEENINKRIAELKKACYWPLEEGDEFTFSEEIEEINKLEKILKKNREIREIRKGAFSMLDITTDEEFLDIVKNDPSYVKHMVGYEDIQKFKERYRKIMREMDPAASGPMSPTL